MSPKTANAIDTYVAGRLRSYRRQLGLSQADVAKKIGITFQQIQKYEAGINRVGAGRLFQIASLYAIPVQDFFPNGPVADDAAKRSAQTNEVAAFASSIDGLRLCEAFLGIKEAKQRRVILSLIEEIQQQGQRELVSDTV
ncbi:transcriptional regulator with XRE-family HTH domain [Rhizomicrobium palustre]|uniref:Transcriptional regulator with XRE-family HTH domain n=1 Tax=Rhizomicrobium palustre TaxID=189966 RepID=A0A846N3V3_9PROT|nr:helix-turn-helix domain-containing protein [Rhizomicrobium palustre]NIK89892.1 transcriptional regulator with XRE-family HTH domain [Rhizomicrobium palustre]